MTGSLTRSRSRGRAGAARAVAVAFASACAASACGGDEGDALRAEGDARAAVTAHVDALAAGAPFAWTVMDLADAREAGDGVDAGEARFLGDGTTGFRLVDTRDCGPGGPIACRTLGSREHVALERDGEIRFSSPRRVLGLHVSLTGAQRAPLEGLEPAQLDDVAFRLPALHVRITALDAAGDEGATLRAIPASATYRSTEVATDWLWVDAHLLGTVSGVRVRVESPIPGLEQVLVDNLTTSLDFADDTDFFAAALVPDTQKYTERPELHATFHAQTAWLAAQRDAQRIAFASHLGDIVEHGDREDEWRVADEAMRRIDGVVPYGIVIGNHDFEEWSAPERGSPLFAKYFPESRFADAPWWGGRSPDGLSSYQRFETPEGPFLYLHLSVDSPPPTVAWAEGVIAAHPGVPTAVTTHVYLRENGRVPVPYMQATAATWPGISADTLFRTFVAKHDQIFLVTCGHVAAEHLQTSENDRGLPVLEMLQDYQNRVDGGEGFLRLLRFYPRRREIRAITYSPTLDTYEMDADSFFTLAAARVPGW